MSGTSERSTKSGRQTLFYRDLASPISSHRGKFSSPRQAAAVSALWRENFKESDLPPPPAFTLDDRSEISPERGLPDWPVSPEVKPDAEKSTFPGSPFLLRSRTEVSPPSIEKQQQVSASSTWWSPSKGLGEQESKEKGSLVNGVVLPGALITLPPPREVARPELQRNTPPLAGVDEEEWVTVYGYVFLYSFVRFILVFSSSCVTAPESV